MLTFEEYEKIAKQLLWKVKDFDTHQDSNPILLKKLNSYSVYPVRRVDWVVHWGKHVVDSDWRGDEVVEEDRVEHY